MNARSDPVGTTPEQQAESDEHPSKSRGTPGATIAIGLVVFALIGGAIWYWGIKLPQDRKAAEQAAKDLKAAGGILMAAPNGSGVHGVDFAGVEMTDEIVANISRLLHVEQLNLSKSGLTDAQLRQIDTVGLVSLVLSGNPVTAKGLENLRGNSSLQALFVKNTQLGDDALGIIGTLSSLTNLDLTGTQISDEGMGQIGSLRKLKFLTLADNEITDQGLVALKPLTELGRLDVQNCPVTDEGIASLRKAIPGLVIDR